MFFFDAPEKIADDGTLDNDQLRLMLPFFRAAVEVPDLPPGIEPNPEQLNVILQLLNQHLTVQNNRLVIDTDDFGDVRISANDLLYTVHKACLRRIQQAAPLRNPCEHYDHAYHAPAFYFHYQEDDSASIRVSFEQKPDLPHFESALYILQTQVFEGVRMDRSVPQEESECLTM